MPVLLQGVLYTTECHPGRKCKECWRINMKIKRSLYIGPSIVVYHIIPVLLHRVFYTIPGTRYTECLIPHTCTAAPGILHYTRYTVLLYASIAYKCVAVASIPDRSASRLKKNATPSITSTMAHKL